MPNIIVREVINRPDTVSDQEYFVYMSMLLQLDDLMRNITIEFEEKLNIGGLYKFDIKKNIKSIYDKLKANPKCKWESLSNDMINAFGEDGEVIEDIFKRLFGLKKGKTVCFVPQFRVGDKVWTMNNDKPTLCKVLSVEIQVSYLEDKEVDNSYYQLEILDKKNKPTGVYIQKGERDIYKHEKELYEDIKR